jgi:glycosyltransferase involved in cell wall biosynthesis
MSMSAMSYSVVIPAFNATATIGEAIASAVAQTALPAEILVVDDGSTDATAALAAQAHPLVRVIVQSNTGCGGATTNGMAESRHAIIATLDADDVWLPDKMARQLARFLEDPTVDGVFSNLELFGKDTMAGQVQAGWCRSTMAVQRHVFDRLGPIIDPPGDRGDMVDWLSRARDAGFRLDLLTEVLVRRRVSPGSLSYGRDPVKDRGYLHVVRERILRKRRAGEPSA